MSDQPVRADLDEHGVLTVRLARPERRNALDRATFTALRTAFAETAHDAAVRAVVLRGDGPAFCAGLDRALLAQLGPGGDANPTEMGPHLQEIFDRIAGCPRPTLAVVQGACVGGGLALALACDFRVASDDAFFSMMEMRYAFLPDLGHLHRLQREVGIARAKEVVFFGERLPAATLGAWGVLAEVVRRDALEEAAVRWTERLATAPTLAVAAAKRVMDADAGGQDGAAAQRAALDANLDGLFASADFREGLAAALEGRPPQFSGR